MAGGTRGSLVCPRRRLRHAGRKAGTAPGCVDAHTPCCDADTLDSRRLPHRRRDVFIFQPLRNNPDDRANRSSRDGRACKRRCEQPTVERLLKVGRLHSISIRAPPSLREAGDAHLDQKPRCLPDPLRRRSDDRRCAVHRLRWRRARGAGAICRHRPGGDAPLDGPPRRPPQPLARPPACARGPCLRLSGSGLRNNRPIAEKSAPRTRRRDSAQPADRHQRREARLAQERGQQRRLRP